MYSKLQIPLFFFILLACQSALWANPSPDGEKNNADSANTKPVPFADVLNQPARGLTPLELAVVSDMQWKGNQYSVLGLRLTMFGGLNRNLYGLDIGPWNEVADSSVGIRFGLYNRTGNSHTGLEIGGLNYSGSGYGLQLGAINRTPKHSGKRFVGNCVTLESQLQALFICMYNEIP